MQSPFSPLGYTDTKDGILVYLSVVRLPSGSWMQGIVDLLW